MPEEQYTIQRKIQNTKQCDNAHSGYFKCRTVHAIDMLGVFENTGTKSNQCMIQVLQIEIYAIFRPYARFVSRGEKFRITSNSHETL